MAVAFLDASSIECEADSRVVCFSLYDELDRFGFRVAVFHDVVCFQVNGWIDVFSPP